MAKALGIIGNITIVEKFLPLLIMNRNAVSGSDPHCPGAILENAQNFITPQAGGIMGIIQVMGKCRSNRIVNCQAVFVCESLGPTNTVASTGGPG